MHTQWCGLTCQCTWHVAQHRLWHMSKKGKGIILGIQDANSLPGPLPANLPPPWPDHQLAKACVFANYKRADPAEASLSRRYSLIGTGTGERLAEPRFSSCACMVAGHVTQVCAPCAPKPLLPYVVYPFHPAAYQNQTPVLSLSKFGASH